MQYLAAALLLALCASLGGCNRSLDKYEVREFIDQADAAARKRFAPEICELRGKNFTLHLKFQGYESRMPPSELQIGRQAFCVEAGKFSRVRQYLLERKSIDVDLAADRKTARVSAHYVETMPYYEPDMMPVTPDDFRHFQVVETRDESVVGIEDGDLVFLSTDSNARQRLIGKNDVSIPYD